MELISIIKRENIEMVVISIIFMVLIFLVLKDFNLTSRKSWGMLLGLTALGGVFAIRAIARRCLFREFEERENRLKEIEKRYEIMKDQNLIIEDEYKKLKDELDRVRKESYDSILQADARIESAQRDREKPQDITKDELIEFLNAYK